MTGGTKTCMFSFKEVFFKTAAILSKAAVKLYNIVGATHC